MSAYGPLAFLILAATFVMSSGHAAPGARIGTGFFVRDDGVLLTNRHVVEGCRNLTVVPADGRRYPARSLAISSTYDLAAIRVDRYKPISILPLRAYGRNVSVPDEGEEVMTGGFSDPVRSEERISIVDGFVVGKVMASNRPPFNTIMLSAIRSGASGSPIVDSGGSFVGVIHSATAEFDRQLPGKFSRFDVGAKFHNNNAVADFLTREGIQFHFRETAARVLPRLQLVGLVNNSTVLIECTQ